MNNKHIPDNLLEYLRSSDWNELNEEVKAELLSWVSEEEYKQLRSAYLGLQAVQATPHLTLKQETRDAVMAQFRKHKKASIWMQVRDARVPAWQAAAAAIILFVLGFAFKPVREILIPQTQVVTIVDTVFVPQPAMAKLMFDSSVSGQGTITKKALPIRKTQPGKPPRKSSPPLSNVAADINILRLDDSPSLNRGGKSSEEDSLISRFGFVQL